MEPKSATDFSILKQSTIKQFPGENKTDDANEIIIRGKSEVSSREDKSLVCLAPPTSTRTHCWKASASDNCRCCHFCLWSYAAAEISYPEIDRIQGRKNAAQNQQPCISKSTPDPRRRSDGRRRDPDGSAPDPSLPNAGSRRARTDGDHMLRGCVPCRRRRRSRRAWRRRRRRWRARLRAP